MDSPIRPTARALFGHPAFPPAFVAGVAFLLLFWEPLTTLIRDWTHDPDSAHGLLLFPLAIYLAWQRGWSERRPQERLGLAILLSAVLLRLVSALSSEFFTMRASMLVAGVGLIIYARGWHQLARWWLPLGLICLSIPLPSVVVNTLALPLQFTASQVGAALLRSRHVPVLLEGNVLRLPDRALFVTEACSGLRSLTALMALGFLIGGLWLRHSWSRVLVLLVAVPVAVAINAIRVFLTGFFVFYVTPDLADGFLHYSEGWGMFVVAFAILGVFAWALSRIELRMAAA